MNDKTLAQVVVELLQEAGSPLHYQRDLYEQIKARGLYDFGEAHAPWQMIRTLLSSDKTRFEWVAPGVYRLRAATEEGLSPMTDRALPEVEGPLKFTDAAEVILQRYANGVPMLYRDVVDLALAEQLIRSRSKVPWESMGSQVRREIEAEGEAARFYVEQGHVGLRAWLQGMSDASPEDRRVTDAVERVLEAHGQEKPLHYHRIAQLLPEVDPELSEGLSENTLFARVLDDIRQARQRGAVPRFFIKNQESIGLTKWQPEADTVIIQQYMELASAWVEGLEMSGRGIEAFPGDPKAFQEALMALYEKLPEAIRATYSDPIALFRALKERASHSDAGGVGPDTNTEESLSIPHALPMIQRPAHIELRLGISGRIGQYYAVKVDSELGDGWGTVKVSAVERLKKRAEQVRALFSHAQLDRNQEKLAEAFGRDLFETFLAPQDIGRLYTLATFQASEQKSRLRIILNIADPDLAGLSWELLYDTFHSSYLSLRRERSSIIREISRLSRRIPLRVEKAPLRILGLIAAPAEGQSLQVEQEKAVIEEALARLLEEEQAELRWIEQGTWDALSRAMRDGPWHIFHFIGHGGFDEERQEGYILLVDDEGNGVPVRAEELGQLLSDNDLRLALLNACESAVGSSSTPLASTAATLMKAGIPAVLAMQHLIEDEAAVEFSREFYEALASGYTVEDAVICARRALTKHAAVSIEWGIPALYLRALDSQLLATR